MSVTGWAFWRHIWRKTMLECKKLIRDQYLWKQRETRGIIKQTSLAKPGPAWRGALEYLPHPHSDLVWVRSRCLGIYILIQDCLIQSCDAGWAGKCVTLAEPFSGAEADLEGPSGLMLSCLPPGPCRVRVRKLWHMLTSLKKKKTIMKKIFIQDINMVSFTSLLGSKHRHGKRNLVP